MSEHTQKCQASFDVVCSCDPKDALLRELVDELKKIRLFIGYEPESSMVKHLDDLLRRAQAAMKGESK